MKFKILLFSLLISTFSFSQNFEEQWKEVMQLELDGKTKSADEIVTKIYKKANRKNNEPEIIKCFFYKSKFLQVLDENASEKIILDIRKEIKKVSKPSKGVLNYIYAQLLTKYLNKNATNIYKRTPIQDNTSQDFLTWSYFDFTNEIEKAYDESIKHKVELRQTSVKDYKEIFEISPYLDGANYSLYDFLSTKYIQFLTSKYSFYDISKSEAFIQSSKLFYENTDSFIKIDNQKFDNKSFQKLIAFFQEKEIFAKISNQNSRDQFYFERLKYFHDKIRNNDLFLDKLTTLEKQTNFLFLKQNIRIELAKHYHFKGYETKDKDKVLKALEYAELVLSQKENQNALSEAEFLKNNILSKSIEISVNKEMYANQSHRAFVNFKNIDTLKINYFK